jgi:hypothetical protein
MKRDISLSNRDIFLNKGDTSQFREISLYEKDISLFKGDISLN